MFASHEPIIGPIVLISYGLRVPACTLTELCKGTNGLFEIDNDMDLEKWEVDGKVW